MRRTANVPVRSRVIGPASRLLRASSALAEFAGEEGASLLVVASEGHGKSPLYRLGGTSERLAQVTTVPTLVIRDPRPFVGWGEEGRPVRVVLGVDDTQTSDSAIAWTRSLLARGDVYLTVVQVYYVNEAAHRYGISRRIAQTEEDPELEGLIVRDLQRHFGGDEDEGRISYRAKLGLGRLGDHLLSVADELAADLVVVGTHRGRGLSRLSSVSSVVLHHAHSSVACIPLTVLPMPRVMPFKRVLVPTDLSVEGNYAVIHACSLCGADGELHLLYVAGEKETRSETELAQALRAQVPKECGALATRTLVLRRENVASTICETAERLGVDAICLAASTKSRLDATLLGSVACEVVKGTSFPILLIRAPRR
jgi:nucleotide-binding universal stress UspA family protein